MNFNLLRPVVFTNLKVGDKICKLSDSDLTVTYKAPYFAVIGYKNGFEESQSAHTLEEVYKFLPLCWVEGKPVYPGDGPLYYKYNPSWKHNEEGVITSGIRDDELHFHGGIAFPIADATWIKPQPERVPSFQVEGQDVFPGDTVYYYGSQRSRWGVAMTVENSGYVVDELSSSCLVIDYELGVASFRLKPQLVIGDRLVPMPEREAPTIGTKYFTPNTHAPNGCSTSCWGDMEYNQFWLARGLVHLNQEAAIAHCEAIIALSMKKD